MAQAIKAGIPHLVVLMGMISQTTRFASYASVWDTAFTGTL